MLLSVVVAVAGLAFMLILVMALDGDKHFLVELVEQVATETLTLKPFLVHITSQSVVEELLELTEEQVLPTELQQQVLV
jgi:hypothetical protein